MLSLKSQKSLTFQIFLPDLEPRIPNLDLGFSNGLKVNGYYALKFANESAAAFYTNCRDAINRVFTSIMSP